MLHFPYPSRYLGSLIHLTHIFAHGSTQNARQNVLEPIQSIQSSWMLWIFMEFGWNWWILIAIFTSWIWRWYLDYILISGWSWPGLSEGLPAIPLEATQLGGSTPSGPVAAKVGQWSLIVTPNGEKGNLSWFITVLVGLYVFICCKCCYIICR